MTKNSADNEKKTKKCKSCKAEKPINEFHRASNVKDGHAGKCKICKNAYVSEWRNKNYDRKTETDRKWSEKNSGRKKESIRLWRKRNSEKVSEYRKQSYLRNYQHIREYHVLWREQHPDKKQCHMLLNEAVYSGNVTKPSSCQICEATGNLHGHHHDYTKPLDVWWLCPSCHHLLHRLERNAMRNLDTQYLAA